MVSPLEPVNVGSVDTITLPKGESNSIEKDISKVKEEKADLKKAMDSIESSKTKLPAEDLEKLKDSYKDLHSVGTKLLGTQEKIIQNFEKIEPMIRDAENLVVQMNGAVDNMKTIVQKNKK
jgi:chromosome segregation ATPase